MTAESVLEKVQGMQDAAKDLVGAGRNVVDLLINGLAEEIVSCPDERAFLDLAGDIGERLYRGNVLTEQFDGPVIRLLLGVLDKQVLDRVFGPNWFTELQVRAQGVADARKG